MNHTVKGFNEFHINGYRLQYWLYAILNKNFGKEVKFRRDSLHGIYEVNRHGFEIATNTMDVADVKNFFVKRLTECGYGDSGGMLVKKTNRNTGVEELVISINGPDSSKKNAIYVGVYAYWRKNK